LSYKVYDIKIGSTTVSIKTVSIKAKFETLGINDTQHKRYSAK